ncbi:HAD family hydrolase [Alkalicoccus luteus]|uniref:HAD family hydrolase n=1 Tax=Alkalicoccus luteus TaxID=1237094 RepID=A0A969TVX3_9BACI|nr:HAD family hydrolase [Alkalicoccus luteus]NJP36789.1 HAD family hydrolase [Alkalicoccus luteus]
MQQDRKERAMYIFDLDGTLYEGTAHFDYYAALMKQELPAEWQKAFERDYEQMKRGEHAVKIGTAYDTEQDTILEVDPFTSRITAVKSWSGEKLDASMYTDGPQEFDFEQIVAIGDGWWLPFACARHYGIRDCQPFYHETKRFMGTESFQLKKIEGLPAFLKQLSDVFPTVLVTNSDAEDTNRLLGELNMRSIFHKVVPSAGKPAATATLFEELINEFGHMPQTVTSVGDNLMNDVAPALRLGMRGVFIGTSVKSGDRLEQAETMSEWMEREKHRISRYVR